MKTKCLVLTGVFSLTSVSAMAGAWSSASIDQASFTLLDLAPADGIAASYELTTASGSNRSWVAVMAQDGVLGETETPFAATQSLVGETSVTRVVGRTTTFASASPEGVVASGVANGPSTNYSAGAVTGKTNGFGSDMSFGIDLSPHSVLVIAVRASAQAWAGNLVCAEANAGNSFQMCEAQQSSAGASLSLNYAYSDSTTSTQYRYFDQVVVGARVEGHYGDWLDDPVTGDVYIPVVATDPDRGMANSRVLTAVFTNSSDSVQHADLSYGAFVFGNASTPVPESSTTALFAVGVAGLWGASRRRRRGDLA
jgi:hypothetical protein